MEEKRKGWKNRIKWKGKGDIRENGKEEKMEEWNKMESKRGEKEVQERGRVWKKGGGRKGKVKNLKPLFYEISGSPRES